MKKLLLILALFVATTLHAELLLTEDFSYPLSTELTSDGWFTSWGAESGITVCNGLVFPGYAGCGVGGAAFIDVDSGSAQAHRAFRTVTAGSVYVAFLFQPTVNYKKGYFLCLRDSAVGGYTFNYVGRVYLSETSKLGLTYGKAGGSPTYSNLILDGQKVYLVVLKYTVLEGTNNDVVSLYAFDHMPASEPSEPLLSLANDGTLPDITPAHVTLLGYDDDAVLVVDGIRVATTWAEAVALGDGECEPQEPDALTEEVAATSSAPVYDLLGRRVTAPAEHGIYIQAGKKIMR